MSKENKKALQYLGIIFIAVLITYKLPHDSYSITQYIIPPIRGDNSITHLSGIVPLILFIIGIRGLSNLERFADKSRLLIFIATILIIIPAMKWTLDVSRTNYHWIKGDGLRAMDIEESNVSISTINDERIISVTLELKDYGRKQNEFKVRVYLPQGLRDYVGEEFYDFESNYYTHGRRSVTNIREEIKIKANDHYAGRQLSDSKWYWEDLTYELYNDEEKVEIIRRGF